MSVTQPAAGAEWTLTASGGVWLRIVSLVALFTTSAVVANRRVALLADNGERVYYRAVSTADQPASLSVPYTVIAGGDAGGATSGALRLGFPVGGLLLSPGHRLRSLVSAIDVGDQWSAVVARVDEYTSSHQVVGDATDETPYDHSE